LVTVPTSIVPLPVLAGATAVRNVPFACVMFMNTSVPGWPSAIAWLPETRMNRVV
jgi:hypothetical protein